MESILLTHAEVAVALAGFAAVVAAFRRPLAPVQRHRFATILLGALQQLLACLVPALLLETYSQGPDVWRLTSQLYLVGAIAIAIILLYPLKRLGRPAIVTVNVPVTVLIYALAVSVLVANVANAFVVETPSFALYYASLLTGLGAIFIAFADVATRDD